MTRLLTVHLQVLLHLLLHLLLPIPALSHAVIAVGLKSLAFQSLAIVILSAFYTMIAVWTNFIIVRFFKNLICDCS